MNRISAWVQLRSANVSQYAVQPVLRGNIEDVWRRCQVVLCSVLNVLCMPQANEPTCVKRDDAAVLSNECFSRPQHAPFSKNLSNAKGYWFVISLSRILPFRHVVSEHSDPTGFGILIVPDGKPWCVHAIVETKIPLCFEVN